MHHTNNLTDEGVVSARKILKNVFKDDYSKEVYQYYLLFKNKIVEVILRYFKEK
jgi:hypothetical protein